MEHLPLLIRHGTAVWIAALSAMVLAAVLGDWCRRRRRARRDAGMRREALVDPIQRLDGAEGTLVTLQGRIVASGAQAGRFEDGAEVAAASAGSRHADALVGARAQRLELVTGGGVVRLDGPVEVIVGEVETDTGRAPDRLGAPLRRRIEEAGGLWSSKEPVVFRSVRSGVPVRVRGELRRGDAGDGLLSYRSGGGTLRLAPPAGEVAAGLRLAYDEAPLRRERGLRAPLQAAGGAVLVFAGIFVGAPELQGRGAIHGEVLAQALAATPFHRARAVAAYTEILDAGLRREPLDAGRLDRLYGMGIFQGRGDRAVQALLDHGQWARAEAEARRSGLPLLAARAAYERGDFAGAASTWEAGSAGVRDGMELLFALRVHLLAGDLAGATRAARRVADGMRDAGLPDFDCIVETLEAQAGASEGKVAATPACALTLLDWTSGDRRASSFWTLHLLAVEAGKEDMLIDGFVVADPLFGPGSEPPRWALVRAALERLQAEKAPADRDLVTRARLAAAMAGFEAACGEHDEALRWAGVASASLAARRGPFDPPVWSLTAAEKDRYESLPGLLLLRAGRPAAAREALASMRHAMPLRLAAALADVAADASGMDPRAARGQAHQFFAESIAGDTDLEIRQAVFFDDGEALSGLLQRGALTPRLLRVAGFTTRDARGLSALSAWLRRGRAEVCHGCDVGARFADVSNRLAVAEEIGDEAMIAELRGIAGAFRRAILRRETALPLLLLEQMKRKWVPPVEIALGDRHTCARGADTTVRCWGSNDHGQLGDGAGGRHLTPGVIPGLADVAQIAAGGDQTCARMKDGTVRCWGGEPSSSGAVNAPAEVPGVTHAARIAVGHGRACAVRGDASLTCWGSGGGPWLAGTPGALHDVRDVALGVDHACALREDGSVWCWGSNAVGQLGDDTPGGRGEPAPVPGVAGAVRLSAGYFHTCALLAGREDAAFTCWGAGDKGQLGDGDPRSRGAAGPPVKFWRGMSLSLGSSFSCGLWGDDSVECWGANALGQLGDGTATGHDRPTSTHFVGIAQVAAGGAHGCLLTKTGEIWCWGANRDGQVGDGSTLLHTLPEMVRL